MPLNATLMRTPHMAPPQKRRSLTTFILGLSGFLSLGSGSSPANEIQLRLATRDDTSDAEYVTLGSTFNAVGRLSIGNRACSGTLVTSTDGTLRVLTAAHCLDRDFDNTPDVSPSAVRFQTGAGLEGANAQVTAIDVPQWDEIGAQDVAVVTLAGFDLGSGPLPLSISTSDPSGAEITMVGYGTHGDGEPPFESQSDSRRRAATNVADQVLRDGDLIGQIRTDFDHPRDPDFSTMGDSTPTKLEGTSGMGDSGSPMIFNGQVVGVLHGGENPTPNSFSEYGDVSIFAGLFHQPNQAFLRSHGILITGPGTEATRVTLEANAASGQRYLAAPDGTRAKAGTTVRLGALPSGFDDLASTDILSVAQAWMPFGELTLQNLDRASGHFSGSQTADGTDFEASKIFWWILETPSGPPATDLANVTSWGLFSSSKSHWKFPTPGSPEPIELLSDEVDEASVGTSFDGERLQLAAVEGFVLDYDQWAQVAFPPESPDEDRHPNADPDGDHIVNAVEWLQDSSPVSAAVTPSIEITKTPSQSVIVRYPRRRFLPAETDRLRFSPNLQNWAISQPTQKSIHHIDGRLERVELEFSLGAVNGRQATMGYWRLEVVEP